MIKIALVGEIGSGKSFISKLFGYPVFNADKEVNHIYLNNAACFNKLKKLFQITSQAFQLRKKN